MHVEQLGRGYAWFDTGTQESLPAPWNFVGAVELRQGLKIACPEEVAFHMGAIDAAQLRELARPLKNSTSTLMFSGMKSAASPTVAFGMFT